VKIDQNSSSWVFCNGISCENRKCPVESRFHSESDGWRIGRRVVKLAVILDRLRTWEMCGFGPVPLTIFSTQGETKWGACRIKARSRTLILVMYNLSRIRKRYRVVKTIGYQKGRKQDQKRPLTKKALVHDKISKPDKLLNWLFSKLLNYFSNQV